MSKSCPKVTLSYYKGNGFSSDKNSLKNEGGTWAALTMSDD